MRVFFVLSVPLLAGACAALVDDYEVKTCGDHGTPDPVCATCEETACAPERAACLADPACAPLARCLESCSADDGACRASCFIACPEPTETLSALTDCRRTSCRDACAACGGAYDTLGEPACSACMRQGCCADMEACFDDPGCGGGVHVRRGVRDDGRTAVHPALPGSRPLLRYAGRLRVVVRPGLRAVQPWPALGLCGRARPPSPREGGHHGSHAAPRPRHAASDAGVTVKACRTTDHECQSPVAVETTDANGMVAHQLPTRVNNQSDGFAGYFEISGPATTRRCASSMHPSRSIGIRDRSTSSHSPWARPSKSSTESPSSPGEPNWRWPWKTACTTWRAGSS